MNTPPDNEARELLKEVYSAIPNGSGALTPLGVAAGKVRAYLARYPEPQHPAKVAFDEWWAHNGHVGEYAKSVSLRVALAFYRKGMEAAAALINGTVQERIILNAAKEVPES